MTMGRCGGGQGQHEKGDQDGGAHEGSVPAPKWRQTPR
jgi:hypothetical protein